MKRAFLFLLSAFVISCHAQNEDGNLNKTKNMSDSNLEYVTIGGGCFWCVQPEFEMLKGVKAVVSGYSGGHTENPTYEQVCTNTTGHAEVIQIEFDPNVISYEKLMRVFLFLHDPTQLNRQGNDVGTQYRSIVLYRNEKQKEETEKILKESESKQEYKGKYVTQVVPFKKFWPAEGYHQDYYYDHPTQPYCSGVTGPKIRKFISHFSELGWLEADKVRNP